MSTAVLPLERTNFLEKDITTKKNNELSLNLGELHVTNFKNGSLVSGIDNQTKGWSNNQIKIKEEIPLAESSLNSSLLPGISNQ